MNISIIVALSKNQVIGVDNQLPWHLPADLKYFKGLTLNHCILMGRNTFESIGRPLPNRENIVITRDVNYYHEGIIVKHSIEEAINECREKGLDELFIIGGDNIYKQCLPFCNKLYITRVDTTIENGDAFFPDPNLAEWELTSCIEGVVDEKNMFAHRFEVYEKRKQYS